MDQKYGSMPSSLEFFKQNNSNPSLEQKNPSKKDSNKPVQVEIPQESNNIEVVYD